MIVKALNYASSQTTCAKKQYVGAFSVMQATDKGSTDSIPISAMLRNNRRTWYYLTRYTTSKSCLVIHAQTLHMHACVKVSTSIPIRNFILIKQEASKCNCLHGVWLKLRKLLQQNQLLQGDGQRHPEFFFFKKKTKQAGLPHSNFYFIKSTQTMHIFDKRHG